MPNHVTNIVSFEGKKKEVEILLNTIKTKKGEKENPIDFNKIIPMPESLNIESGSSVDDGIAIIEFQENGNSQKLNEMLKWPWVKSEGIKTPKALADYLIKKGTANLDMARIALENIKKYGHKDWYSWSNANWGTKWNSYSHDIVNENTISFQTAWSAPLPVIEKLSEMFPGVTIKIKFADEDFGHNCGELKFLGGEEIAGFLPKGGSTKAIKLAAEVQGYGASDLIDMYRTTEDDEDFLKTILQICIKDVGFQSVTSMLVNVSSDEYYDTTDMLETFKSMLLEEEKYELIAFIDDKINEIKQGELN